MDAAALLGLKNVNTFIGNDHRQPFEVNFSRFREVWPDLIKYAEERDLYIGIENCPMLFTLDEWPGGKNLARSPDIWRKMFAEIPSDHFGLNYDPSHFVMQIMDCIAPIFEFGKRIFHAHAKDMRIDRRKLDQVGVQALPPAFSTPKIPGLGDVNWGQFISALSDVGYTGPVCIEVEDHAFSRTLDDRKQSLRISRNVLRPLLG
jgi:sugar phosphate isomerase/epimerase